MHTQAEKVTSQKLFHKRQKIYLICFKILKNKATPQNCHQNPQTITILVTTLFLPEYHTVQSLEKTVRLLSNMIRIIYRKIIRLRVLHKCPKAIHLHNFIHFLDLK